MTEFLQPLDLVVCGLIKLVQWKRRGMALVKDLSRICRAAYEKECGQAVLAGRKDLPPVPQWHPEKPSLMQGIFYYQKTHNEELQSATLKQAKVYPGEVFHDNQQHSSRPW